MSAKQTRALVNIVLISYKVLCLNVYADCKCYVIFNVCSMSRFLFCRDIRDMRAMLREMIETVDVKPWTVEPRIDASKFGIYFLFAK